MVFAVRSTLASKVQIEISPTYTDIPGTQDIEISGVENSSMKTGGLADSIDTNLGTGVGDPGSVKFSLLWDPLDAVHQDIETRHNAGGVSIPIKIFVSALSVTYTVTVTSKKLDIKADKKGGWTADVEWEFEDAAAIAYS